MAAGVCCCWHAQWERTSRSPTGHYVKVIGAVGDKDAETDLLVTQHTTNNNTVHDTDTQQRSSAPVHLAVWTVLH